MKNKQIAIIPARGGSKRIKNKNIIGFCGKPLIAWTIEAALESDQFTKVVVSTDDDMIAAEAEKYGALVPFLRKQYADDQSPISIVTIDFLKRIDKELGENFDVVVQLMPNCPLRNVTHINDAIANFYSKKALSQISCFKYGWMNPWWAVKLSNDGHPENIFPETMLTRSQDLPDLYCPSGAIWIADVKHLIDRQTFYSDERILWEMPWDSAIDIDDYDDLKMAKVLKSINGLANC